MTHDTSFSWPARFSRKDLFVCVAISAAAVVAVFATTWWVAIAAALALCIVPLGWQAFAIPGRWIAMFLAAVILLPPLPLPGGDTGPHPSVLIAGIGLLAGVARASSWRMRWNALNIAMIVFFAVLTLSLGSAAIHSGAGIAAGSAARTLLFGIGVYVFFAASSGPDRVDAARMTRALFWIALAAAAFGCIDFVFQLPAPAGYGAQFLWLDSGVYRRAQGLFYEASTLGNFCTFFVVMAVLMMAEPRARRVVPGPILAAGIVVFAAAMLLSFSRSSVVACMVSAGTAAILERHRWARHRALIALLVVVPITALSLAAALPEVTHGYWDRFSNTFDNLLSAPDRALSGRLENWRVLGGFMLEHPFQTAIGIGYKTLPYTQHLGRPVIADNMYLSILVETGVLGLAALMALNAAILAASWRAMRRGSFHGRWMFCFWIGEMFQMLSADILTYWRVLPVYFWVLAQAVLADHADSDT